MSTFRHFSFNPNLLDVKTVLYQAKPEEVLYKIVPYDMYTWVAIFETPTAPNSNVGDDDGADN